MSSLNVTTVALNMAEITTDQDDQLDNSKDPQIGTFINISNPTFDCSEMHMRKKLYSDVSVKESMSIKQGKKDAFTKEAMMNANFLFADGRARNNQQSRALSKVDKQRLSIMHCEEAGKFVLSSIEGKKFDPLQLLENAKLEMEKQRNKMSAGSENEKKAEILQIENKVQITVARQISQMKDTKEEKNDHLNNDAVLKALEPAKPQAEKAYSTRHFNPTSILKKTDKHQEAVASAVINQRFSNPIQHFSPDSIDMGYESPEHRDSLEDILEGISPSEYQKRYSAITPMKSFSPFVRFKKAIRLFENDATKRSGPRKKNSSKKSSPADEEDATKRSGHNEKKNSLEMNASVEKEGESKTTSPVRKKSKNKSTPEEEESTTAKRSSPQRKSSPKKNASAEKEDFVFCRLEEVEEESKCKSEQMPCAPHTLQLVKSLFHNPKDLGEVDSDIDGEESTFNEEAKHSVLVKQVSFENAVLANDEEMELTGVNEPTDNDDEVNLSSTLDKTASSRNLVEDETVDVSLEAELEINDNKNVQETAEFGSLNAQSPPSSTERLDDSSKSIESPYDENDELSISLTPEMSLSESSSSNYTSSLSRNDDSLSTSPYSTQSEDIFANLINNAKTAKTTSPDASMSSSSSLCSSSSSSAASWNSTEDENELFKSERKKKNTKNSDTSQQQDLQNVSWSLTNMSEGRRNSSELEDKTEEESIKSKLSTNMNKEQIVMEDTLSIYDESVASHSPAPPLLHNNNMQAFRVERTNNHNRYMGKLYSPACDSSRISITPPPLSNSIRAAVNPREQQPNRVIVQDEKENIYSPTGDSLCSYSPLLMSRASNSIGETIKTVQTKPKPSDLGLSPTQRTPMQARKWRILAAEAEAKKQSNKKKRGSGMTRTPLGKLKVRMNIDV